MAVVAYMSARGWPLDWASACFCSRSQVRQSWTWRGQTGAPCRTDWLAPSWSLSLIKPDVTSTSRLGRLHGSRESLLRRCKVGYRVGIFLPRRCGPSS